MIIYVAKSKPGPYNKPALNVGMSDYFTEPADVLPYSESLQ
jgi:hypothetical protein